MKSKYSRFYAIIKQINNAGGNINKADLILSFTSGRTDKLNDLSFQEFQELERNLIASTHANHENHTYANDHLDKTRKAIISQFKCIGTTTQNAIDWAEKYGVNGAKKRFNDYNGQELFKLLINARKMKEDYIKSINQKMNANGL